VADAELACGLGGGGGAEAADDRQQVQPRRMRERPDGEGVIQGLPALPGLLVLGRGLFRPRIRWDP
jgi:hypothetical protein